MKTLVTGGTGFVGSHLIEELRRRGDDVAALVRSPEKARRVADFGADPVNGDLRGDAGLLEAVRDREVVYHVAGLIKAKDEEEFLEVNRDGTRRITEAAARAGVRRFILVSSLAAGGPSEPGRRRSCDETARPVTAYGRSKLAAEQVVLDCAVPWTIVRPPVVYGPRDLEVLKVFRLARRGWVPVFGDGTQELSAVFATDLASALVATATTGNAAGKIYCPCHPEVFTSRDLALEVGRALESPVRTVPLPAGLARAVLTLTGVTARVFGRATILNRDKANEFLEPAWTGDPSPLERDTGWSARYDLSRGLALTATWYRQAGWL